MRECRVQYDIPAAARPACLTRRGRFVNHYQVSTPGPGPAYDPSITWPGWVEPRNPRPPPGSRPPRPESNVRN